MLKDKLMNGNTSARKEKPAGIYDNSTAAKIGNSAALSFYNKNDTDLPVIQRTTAKANVMFNGNEYKVLWLVIKGRPVTGFKDGKKDIQGNHTLSAAALDFYQQEMVEGQSLTDVITFYENLRNELEAESEMLLQFHKSDPERFELFGQRRKHLSEALDSLKEKAGIPNDAMTVCSYFQNMVVCFEEMYASSAYATDGLEATGQKRENMGINHLNEIKDPQVRIELLKLLTLVDFDAIEGINQAGYTTEALLCKTGNISMGLPFDGNILTPSGAMAEENLPKKRMLQNIGNVNPAVMRLMIMAARIQNKHRAGLAGTPYLDSRLSAVLPEGVPSQSGALTNLSRDMLLSFGDTGSISPLLSRSLQPDIPTPERTYPIKDSSEINAAVTNMAVCACNVIANQIQKENKNDTVYDDRRVTRNYIFQYLQGILLCDYRRFAPPVHEVRVLLNTHDTESEKKMAPALYCAFYKEVHLKLCHLVVLPTYCKVIPESELS